MVDVFEEVEEELRSERYKRLAQRWLPVIGGVLGVALIVALGWWGWQSWQTKQADAASAAFQRGLETLQGGNPIGADSQFVEAAKRGGAYKVLALQMRAEVALQQNKVPEAIAFLDEAAGASRDPLLRDAPALKAAMLTMDTDATLADIEARLEPLTGDKRPLRYQAREALALARLQHGQVQPARETLVALQRALDAPQDVTQRAEAAVELIDNGGAANLPQIVTAMRSSEAQAQAQAQAQARAQAQAQAQRAPQGATSGPATAVPAK
ncbi:MAG: tetratricopeptide repeat protein [Brevundimonas sp.]|nr:MAG: tetratricopeptide repeat protein [Brevundimonas sp.]